ncbi:DNA polymerase III subunit chi [Orbaceae bacterium ac157xtp]
MVKKVIFYLIENQIENNDSSLLLHEKLACQKVVENWQNGLRMLILCEDQAQAERVDECLWQLDTNSFVPHNLVGEGLNGGSPVEIVWGEKRGNGNRQLLINLQNHFADFASVYNDIIDFVPADNKLKELARERYKSYKSVGFQIKTIPTSV